MDDYQAVEVVCELVKVQSMAAGQFRVTLDLPGHLAEQAAWLMQQAARTGVLYRAVIAVEEKAEEANEYEAWRQ